MQNLIKIFEALPIPEPSNDSANFSATQLEGTSHRIAKDSSGSPVLLLQNNSNQRGARIHLEHLDIQHSVRCRVTSDKNTEEDTYTVVRCIDADSDLVRYFLHTIDPILKTLGPTPAFTDISQAITHLTELFRALTQPPIKSVSGLWAELFVIRNSKDIKVLLRAWHIAPEEKYDFSSSTQRIEVKGTSRRDRIHHFSLEQLTPPAGCKVVVASLFVERNGGGMSLGDMIEEIRKDLVSEPDLQERLDRVVASTLGNALRQSLTSRFDRELAKESLSFFDAATVPKISQPLPSGIQDVHFKSNLNQSTSLNRNALMEEGGIFALL